MNDILFGNNNTKTIKRLSKQYFKKNKVRNLAAILAIVLTAFLFTSITSLAFNMVSSMQLSMQMQKGSKGDGTFGYMTEEQFEQLKNSDFVEQAGHRRTIGYASNALGHSVELNYADSIQQELTFCVPTHGSAPEKANEIAIDRMYADNNKVKVGDTITHIERPCSSAIDGFEEVKPMVFAGVYPIETEDFENLRASLEKLQLNDASLTFQPESSAALGFGFRCGFLGLLHMEIIMERLEREYNLDLITTAPNVVYRITKTSGETIEVYTPLNYPDPAEILQCEEPFVRASILTPPEYVGNIMELCQQRRGEYRDMTYLDEGRVELHYFMPLNEIIYDFFDALKSRTRGYGSLDYELEGYRPSKLVKLDILLNGEIVDALSFILFADNAYARARKICEKLKENIPRQMFEIPVQAAVGGKIIARETIKALRKDVLAKCYGGDITRKKKLLEKQKEGKKRMRTFGTVAVPSEAFMAVLKLDEE